MFMYAHGLINAPPPFLYARKGNLHTFPSPILNPMHVKRKSIFLANVSLSGTSAASCASVLDWGCGGTGGATVGGEETFPGSDTSPVGWDILKIQTQKKLICLFQITKAYRFHCK